MNRQPRILFWAILALGAFLRLRGLGRESLWHDEAWTWGLIRDGPGRLLDLLRHRDVHPPLFYLLLQPFTLLGTSEAVLRLPSALLGIASLPLVHRFASKRISPSAGLMAMLLLTLSPFHIFFSQEARSYSLLFFLCAASLNLLLDLLDGPSRRTQALLALCTAGIMLTHYSGGFFILAEVVFVLLHRRERQGLVRDAALSALGSLLLFLPWFPSFIAQIGSVASGSWVAWMPEPSVGLLGAALYKFVAHPYYPHLPPSAVDVWLAVMTVAPFYLLLVLTPILTRRRQDVSLLLLFAVPIAGELLVSLAKPLFYARTLIHVLIPMFVLAAAGALELPRRLRAAACILLAGCLAAPTLHLHRAHSPEKEAWRDATELLARSISPGEIVIVDEGYSAIGLEYYAEHNGLPREWLTQVRRIDSGTLDHPPSTPDLTRTGIWVVFRHGSGRRWLETLSPAFERRAGWKSRHTEVHYFRRRAE